MKDNLRKSKIPMRIERYKLDLYKLKNNNNNKVKLCEKSIVTKKRKCDLNKLTKH